MECNSSSILFLGKAEDQHSQKAIEYIKSNFTNYTICLGDWGDPLPQEARMWEGDYIISYLSRWIVSEKLLKKAKHAAINFHPAPPEYPGVGCINFALYEGVSYYGATCHHMNKLVDTGKIIAVKRFPVFSSDTVATLLERTYDYQLTLFYDIVNLILSYQVLPTVADQWTRKPFTRTEFNDLFRISADMTKAEIDKRVRATCFKRWAPFMELNGHVFRLEKP
jgi:methionyl-tRNA formyltransferase